MLHSEFRPKQTLGQNFLIDDNIGRKIIQAIAPKPNDIIVEIGPGFGALTTGLVDSGAHIIGVEIDSVLAARLSDRLKGKSNWELIENDFLKVELKTLQKNQQQIRVVGNIPYHITSPVIFKIFAASNLVTDMILMIQSEVADRIVAKPRTKDYGILAVVSRLYSEPGILFKVSGNVFKPRPDVESKLVKWDLQRAPDLMVKDEASLRNIIRLTFNQRRKMLRKSLQQLSDFKAKMASLNFDLERRPEELTIAEFVDLSNQLVID